MVFIPINTHLYMTLSITRNIRFMAKEFLMTSQLIDRRLAAATIVLQHFSSFKNNPISEIGFHQGNHLI